MADDTIPQKTASKTGAFFQKHKTAIIGVGAVVALFVVYMIYRNNSGATSSGTIAANPNASTGFDPNAGLGSTAGLPGPAGPAGATGARGPRGPRGWPPKKKKPIKKKKPPPGGGHAQQFNGPINPAINLANRTQFHTAQPGDTMASISTRHGFADTSTLHGMNHTVLGSGPVMPGQRVRVR